MASHATASSSPPDPVDASANEGRMARVVHVFGASYIKAHKHLPEMHRRALHAILACRTPRLGAHEAGCGECGVVDLVYHSCRHRACPRCSSQKNQDWIDRRAAEELPLPHFQVVFTLPSEFRSLFRKHPKAGYSAFLAAQADTLQEVVAKRHGGRVGFMSVLHTWTRKLTYHPHTHNLVPGAVLLASGKLKRIKYLASERQLSKVFKTKFLQRLRAVVDVPHELGSTHHKKWVVKVIEASRASGQRVIEYLGRYIFRVALSDHRIVKVTDTHVTFLHKDENRENWQELTLTGHEFLRRFLEHVLPKGFNKVRYYGLMSSALRATRLKLRAQLLAGQQGDINAPEPGGHEPKVPEPKTAADHLRRCPHCGKDARVIYRALNPAQTMAMAARDGVVVPMLSQRPPP